MKDLKETAENYEKEGYYPFHMPGHKRRDLVFPGTEKWDFTEIEGFDDLHRPTGILLEAEKRAADLYGSNHTAFLVNGSTAGILSSMHCAFSEGDTILCPRNVHRSVLNGIYANRLRVVWLPNEWLFSGVPDAIRLSSVKQAYKVHPEIRGMLLTSPSYEGVLSETEKIAAFCREAGLTLIVDEAHGAHFLPCAKGFPKSAVSFGADFVIQSLHKTLPALTQTALLHVRCSSDFERLERSLSIYQTSSPSYLLMGSIDRCIHLLSEKGEELFSAYRKLLLDFRQNLGSLENLELWPDRGRDPGKLLIRIKENRDLTGRELLKTLRENYKLELEMAGADYVLAMTGIMDTKEGFLRLSAALQEIDQTIKIRENRKIPPFPTKLPEKRMELYEAMNAPSEKIPLSAAPGRILSESILLYPPGTPLFAAGEVADPEAAALIRSLSGQDYTIYGLYPGDRVSVVKEERI